MTETNDRSDNGPEQPQNSIEESYKLKRKLLRMILAVVPAALMPLAALSQIAPEKPARVSTEPVYKYQAFAGWGYTSLNQVNQSRSGLQGYTLSFTRDWGRYFGVTVDGSQYAHSVTTSNAGSPVVDLFLAGPVVHAQLYERLSGFAHALLGVEHTGGVTISPNASFAGGGGAGIEYAFTPRIALRIYGDDIVSSFTVVPFQQGDSPHERANARAGVGVVYRF
jgi:hypothetical protein